MRTSWKERAIGISIITLLPAMLAVIVLVFYYNTLTFPVVGLVPAFIIWKLISKVKSRPAKVKDVLALRGDGEIIDYYQSYLSKKGKEKRFQEVNAFLESKKVHEWEWGDDPNTICVKGELGSLVYKDGELNKVVMSSGKVYRPKRPVPPIDHVRTYYHDLIRGRIQDFNEAIQNSPDKKFTFNLEEIEGKKSSKRDRNILKSLLEDLGFVVVVNGSQVSLEHPAS